MALSEQETRNLVLRIHSKNIGASKSFIVNICVLAGVPRSSAYRILSRIENEVPITRKQGSGRVAINLTPEVKRALERRTAGKVTVSYRKLGRDYGLSDHTVKKYLDSKNIIQMKRSKAPLVTDGQVIRQKSALRRLAQDHLKASKELDIVMDDETYFTLNGYDWTSKCYYSDPNREVDASVKHYHQCKFPDKLMLWIAISRRGASAPAFFRKGMAVSSSTYQKLCLPKLKRFIDQHHQDGKYVFWPDLASAHYAKDTIAKMESLGIKYLPKAQNPPNVPQLRPIEDFWSILKRKVYENGYKASNLKQLENRIRYILKSFDDSQFQRLLCNTAQKVRKAARVGADQFNH